MQRGRIDPALPCPGTVSSGAARIRITPQQLPLRSSGPSRSWASGSYLAPSTVSRRGQIRQGPGPAGSGDAHIPAAWLPRSSRCWDGKRPCAWARFRQSAVAGMQGMFGSPPGSAPKLCRPSCSTLMIPKRIQGHRGSGNLQHALREDPPGQRPALAEFPVARRTPVLRLGSAPAGRPRADPRRPRCRPTAGGAPR